MYHPPPSYPRGGRGRGRGGRGRDDGWHRGRGQFEGSNQYRGGRGGGGGGRGVGGGGGRGVGCPPRRSEIKVLANYYKLEPEKSMELTQYSVEIKKSCRDPESKERIVNTKKGPLDLTTSSGMSRRILKQLSDDLMASKRIPVRLISDGGVSAYALEHFLKNANGEISDSEIFTVTVKKDCEKNDPDADKSHNVHFFVELKKAGKVTFVKGRNEGETTRQFMDILLKSALLSTGMKAFGRSPRVFYFDTQDTKNSWTDRLKAQYDNRNNNFFEPMVGVLNAVKLCTNGNQSDYYIKTSSVIDYAWPPIKVFDPLSKKIGGIQIPRTDSYILDTHLQNEIRKLLKTVKLKVEYTSTAPPKRHTQENTEGKIFSSKRTRRNAKLTIDHRFDNDIIWIPDDANVHGVDWKDNSGQIRKITVAEYFQINHGVTVRYPKMPLICIGKRGNRVDFSEWYPLEFFSMEFDKIKGANTSDQVKAKLDFYSNNGGYALVQKQREFLNQAMDLEIERMGNLGLTPDYLLNQYNLRRSSEPVQVTAKILKEPSIHFGNTSASIKNGSWSVANRGSYNIFETPAKLHSFAYVDFSRENNTFLRDFFDVASKHGMDVPSDKLISACKIPSDSGHINYGTGKIVEMVEDAIKKARSVFLQDSTNYFAERNIQARSRVENPGGFHSECLVLEMLKEHDEVALMLPRLDLFASHSVIVNGSENTARKMVKVREFTSLVDPFDCYFDRSFMVEKDGKRVTATFERFCYELSDGRIVEEKDISEIYYYVVVAASKVECPSILFAVMDTNEPQNDQYAFIKYLCMYKFGIQSQCIAHSQYRNQQRKEQYCSNVAIKVNAKLSNSTTNARAWATDTLPWLKEASTLVMGISKSNQPGGMDSKSIVVASACLDVHSMRVAHDVRLCSRCNDSIYEDVLVYLTTSILAQYYSVNKVVPKRMLIYREGVSEGTFDHVASHEIDSIRKGYHRFATEVLGSESNCSCTAGCNLCCPLITFVACMLNTNIKIVPEFPQIDGVCRDKYGKGVFNVPSGSCIDDVIVDGPPANVYGEIHTQRMKLNNPNRITCFSEPGSNGFDFILVAHGSGLGTSKPVHYRVLLNENVVLKAGENCTPLTRETLENLTNQMSYQYSTATKAIRMVPVIYYGSRLATMTIKYLNYLESQSELDKLEIDMSRLFLPENRQGDGESNGDSNRSQRRRFGARRDNQDDARFIFTRKGASDDEDIPAYMKGSLLPYFGALSKDGLLKEPFSTHVSA